MIIRGAVVADAERIAEVHIRSWQQAYAGQLPAAYLASLDGELEVRAGRWHEWMAAGTSVWVAEVAEAGIVGFAGAASCQLFTLYVLSEHWGRGIGGELLRAAEAALARAGCEEAILWVLDTNTRAREFYGHRGWMADGSTQVEERDGFSLREVGYRKRLDSRSAVNRRSGPPSA